jgi:sugar lactone lactonase YvrE
MGHSGSRVRTFGQGLFLLFFMAFATLPSTEAQAAPGCEVGVTPCPPPLSKISEYGAGLGQITNPAGIAADPVTGHVFIAEASGGERISEFDSSGDFSETWGQAGSGAGQFNLLTGIALDGEGNVWTIEALNGGRLQKFTPEGEFLLMVGGEVNKTKVELREEQEVNAEPVTVTEAEENLCIAATGDLCGEATNGTGPGEFSIVGFFGALEVSPDGLVHVGDNNRIQKFDEEGTYEGEIPIPGGARTDTLTFSPDGRLYVINSGVTHVVTREDGVTANSPIVREIGPSGEELGRLTAEWDGHEAPQFPRALAADAEGNVYVTGTVVNQLPTEEGQSPKFKNAMEVVAFDDDGNLISFEPDNAGFGSPTDGTALGNLATNVVGDGSGLPGEVFVGHFSQASSLAYVRSYGIPYEEQIGPPEIEDEYVASVAATEATVEAVIKPGFTVDTTYQVEYGTGICSAGDCGSLAPAEPADLDGGGVNTGIATGPIILSGLLPGIAYHYRFRAQNEVTNEEGTGPVFGEEGTFRTFLPLEQSPGCPNTALRSGTSAQLPDCRAHEMVSPVDKEGGEVLPLFSITGFPAGIDQGVPAGEAFTYSSYRAFADPEAAPFTSQYVARRDPVVGWSSEPISPPREKGIPNPTLDTEYTLFLEDLSSGWMTSDFDPPLTEDAIAGYRNLYQRDNETGAYEALCPIAPPQQVAGEFRQEAQGKSEDGSHLVFRANDKLTDDALAGVTQVYECIDGTELRLVGILPGGEASPAGSSAGTAEGGMGGFGLRVNSVNGAVSEDGSRIFWTAAANGPGPLYVRIDGQKTVQITGADARFRAASPDGTRVIYTAGDNLFEASVGDEAATSMQIAGDVDGVMGASQDTELVYFVSGEDLDGGGLAAAGKPNLYLYLSGPDTYDFIGILSAGDASQEPEGSKSPVLTPVSLSPFHRSSRVSADGLHAAFTSTAPLTGFDNTDQKSGEADAEVFLYDAEADELLCASCSPAGARPRGANLTGSADPFWSAAHIPGWENQFHASRALSEDGNRLFFEAADRLALEDTNNAQDVYQWEAPGTGTCTEASITYSPQNGGCIDLISSGKSQQPSELVDASADGADVFFKTTESLWAGDPGLADIYDARIGGGFPPPPPPVDPCKAGIDCQERGPAPIDSTPATATVGPGNVVEKPKPKPKRCRKGTHKVKKAGKVRCVKNKKGKANKNRRAAR